MARIVLYPTAVYRTARAKGIEVCRPLAREVLQGGKHLAPKGTGLHGSGRTDNRTSLLQGWQPLRFSESRKFVAYDVVNISDHAATVAVGSAAHDIRASAGRILAFHSDRFAALRKKQGKTARALFYARKVRHPGNKRPVRYLQTPLAQFGRKRGFKVETVRNNRTRLP